MTQAVRKNHRYDEELILQCKHDILRGARLKGWHHKTIKAAKQRIYEDAMDRMKR